MPRRTLTALTKRAVDAAAPGEKDVFLWCGRTPGFGLRVYPSGRKVFIAQVRIGREQRRIKVGDYGAAFTVEEARIEAGKIIQAAAKGSDPQQAKREQREAMSVAELCDAYMEAAKAGRVVTRFGKPKRPSTLLNDTGRIERHIKPLIGHKPARTITATSVQKMMDAIAAGKTSGKTATGKKRGTAVISGGPIVATRVAELLGGIWTWGAKRGHVPALPLMKNVDKTKAEPRDRILSGAELGRLGEAIRAIEDGQPMVAAALRLIALTGARREEIVGLKWDEIDVEGSCLRLAQTKTGKSMRALGAPAVSVLANLPKLHDDLVFPNRNHDKAADLKKRIAAVFAAAELDTSSHDLRRTFASIGAQLEYSDATLGELLGHARRSVVAKHYARRPDAVLVAAATAIATKIDAAMSGHSAVLVSLGAARPVAV